jgi:catechol 2,3-dioxygenase-like lactoylglutathione lyase family enzyme
MTPPVVAVRGLWHVALRVQDLDRAQAFYRDIFGMQVVWAPDPENVYLSSGRDNLALHRADTIAANGALDHIGFIVDSAETVFAAAERVRARGVPIVHDAKTHRDGSASFYCRDPDGNVVQVLWIPPTMLQP